MKKRNPVAKSLFTRQYKSRKVKPKKGKGSFKRKPKYNQSAIFTLKLTIILSSSEVFGSTECHKYDGNINNVPSLGSIF